MRKERIPIFLMFHNNLEWTKICIDHIIKNTNRDLYDLVLIDNGSSDLVSRRISYIAQENNFVFFRFEISVGTPFAYDFSIRKHAIHSKRFITLHNDVLVSEGWLDGLVGCANVFEDQGNSFSCIYPRTNYCHIGSAVDNDLDPHKEFLKHKSNNKILCSETDLLKIVQKTYEPFCAHEEAFEEYATKVKDRYGENNYSFSQEINTFCTMFNSEVYFKFGGFDVDFMMTSEECRVYNEIASANSFYAILALGVYVHHNGNTTNDGPSLDFSKDFAESAKMADKKIIEYRERSKRMINLNTKMQTEKTMVLLIRDLGIGDIIMSLFSFADVRKKMNMELTLCTKEPLVEFFSWFDCVDRVVPFSHKRSNPVKEEEILEISGAYSEKYDIVLNMIDYFEKFNKKFETHRIYQVVDYLLNSDIGNYIQGVETSSPKMTIPEDVVQRTRDIVERGFTNNALPLIAIAPEGTCDIRTMNRIVFSKICARESKNKRVVVLGEKKEEDLIENDNILDLRGSLSLGDAAAVINKCEYLYCPDSGMFHIAGVLGIPCRSFFGSIDPSLRDGFYPSSENNINYYRKKMDCVPCFDIGCPELSCMNYSDEEIERIIGGESLDNDG